MVFINMEMSHVIICCTVSHLLLWKSLLVILCILKGAHMDARLLKNLDYFEVLCVKLQFLAFTTRQMEYI